MKIFGLAGWSGSGKTTLMLKLIATLTGQGLAVASIKRTHHLVEVDAPGDDSRLLREAGAAEVLVASPARWALIHELRDAPEPRLADVVPHFAPADLLLVEGFKRNRHPKLEVYRPDLGKPLLCAEDPDVLAIATTDPDAGYPVPALHLDDVEAIAALVRRHCGL